MKNLLLFILLMVPSLIFCQGAEEIFIVVDEMPRFPGCEEKKMTVNDMENCAKEKMLQYIYSHLKYPEAARNQKIEGIVVVQFVIDADGSIYDAKVVREIGGGAGQAALDVVNSMNQIESTDTTITFNDDTHEETVKLVKSQHKWRPGYQRGKAVKMLYTLPIRYKLAGEAGAIKKVQTSINDHELSNHDQNSDKLFKVVEEMPRFPGCEDLDGTVEEKRQCANQKLIEHIYQNLKYPEAARKDKIEGVTVVQFVIEVDGSISHVTIARDIGGGCGEAALKVVNSMNHLSTQDTIAVFNDVTYEEEVRIELNDIKWRPGYQDGKAVRVLYTLPVKYKLSDEKTETSHESAQKESSEEWISFPSEYGSFHSYKELVLIPAQVKIAYQVVPIETNKIVGDIIPFGETMHPLLMKMGTHNGIDFRAVPGVSVMATGDGVVSFLSRTDAKYGQVVKIQHNDKTESLYAHMSEIIVTEGQQVKAGDQIGAVGMSGEATYPHLHYEVLVEHQTVDPQLNQLDRINASEPMSITSLKLGSPRKPLFVVDGVTQDRTFSPTQIDIDEIAEMRSVKGEKAVEKYGVQGKRGVVEITMKSPHVTQHKLKKQKFELQQNYPNPVMDQTNITFHLPTAQSASLSFYNQAGEFVHSVNEGFIKGENQITLSADDIKATGVVYYFLIQGYMTKVQKMMIVK